MPLHFWGTPAPPSILSPNDSAKNTSQNGDTNEGWFTVEVHTNFLTFLGDSCCRLTQHVQTLSLQSPPSYRPHEGSHSCRTPAVS